MCSYRYNTGVSTFLCGLVDDFHVFGEEIGRGGMILAARSRGNRVAGGSGDWRILIFPLKIMIFEQNPGILGLWRHSEGFLEVPRGVNCAHIGIIRGYLRFYVDWWGVSTFFGRKL